MGVVTRLETITPKKAQELLDARAKNRPINERYANILAGAMQAGEWEVNGETIKENKEKQMVDGQHRCMGIILSNTTIKSFVTRGLENGTFDTIDTGSRRTVGHVLAKNGESNCVMLSGAISWLWRYNLGIHGSLGALRSPRHPEALAVLAENPGMRESIPFGQSTRKLCSCSMIVALHYLATSLCRKDADFFFDKLASGEDIAKTVPKTSAIYVLRARLTDNRSAKAKLRRTDVFNLIIKAWNLYRAKKVVRSLRYTTEGDSSEGPQELR